MQEFTLNLCNSFLVFATCGVCGSERIFDLVIIYCVASGKVSQDSGLKEPKTTLNAQGISSQ
jgi:hypothetical protein